MRQECCHISEFATNNYHPLVGKRMLLLPPDHTRLYSMAGLITIQAIGRLRERGVLVDVMLTLGTHNAMQAAQLRIWG